MTRKEFKVLWAPHGNGASRFVSDLNLLIQSEIETYEKLKLESERKGVSFKLSRKSLSPLAEFTLYNYSIEFSTLEKAKAFAEDEYGNPINWKDTPTGGAESMDLMLVMYSITKKIPR